VMGRRLGQGRGFGAMMRNRRRKCTIVVKSGAGGGAYT
jgi:hypothetical protein